MRPIILVFHNSIIIYLIKGIALCWFPNCPLFGHLRKFLTSRERSFRNPSLPAFLIRPKLIHQTRPPAKNGNLEKRQKRALRLYHCRSANDLWAFPTIGPLWIFRENMFEYFRVRPIGDSLTGENPPAPTSRLKTAKLCRLAVFHDGFVVRTEPSLS